MKLKSALVYLRSASRAFAQRPDPRTIVFAARWARDCIELYERSQPNLLHEARPWMCFPAIQQLDHTVTARSRVFEYGSGGSTIYFALRAAEVVSIEHDPVWYQHVRVELECRHLTNVDSRLIEPVADRAFDAGKIADPVAYVSNDPSYSGKTFRSYAQAIDTFPDRYFDLVVIDGRARPSCILHGRGKVRSHGKLLLDQSERPYYMAKGAALLDPAQWRSVRYMGPLPHTLQFTEATFFTRSNT